VWLQGNWGRGGMLSIRWQFPEEKQPSATNWFSYSGLFSEERLA